MNTTDLLEWLRDEALKRRVDFMDARVTETEGTSISLQDGKADRVSQWKNYGLGVRVLLQGAWGFAATNLLERQEALECLEAAISMANASRERLGEIGQIYKIEPVRDRVEAEFEKDPRAVPIEEKMKMLSIFEKAAVEYAKEKTANTVLWYGDSISKETVANTLGTLIESNYVRTNIGTTIVAQEGNIRQRGYEGRAGLKGFELVEALSPEDFSVKAAEKAVSLLSARRAPAGKFPVIFHPETAGLLIHEALGHNAEADLVLGGESILEGKLGQKIASDCITVIDDATIEGLWGFYKYDSEGVPAKKRIIIENGVLKGFMHSLETAAKFGTLPNGSARAQDFNHRPIVRMSNTYIAPGETPFKELIRGIDLGILVKGGQWGYVFCEKGQYTCHVGEGWMIKNGELAEHIRDVSVSGMILETLMNADAVSKEFEFEKGGGMCGKGGQGVPVSGGGPYVRVKEVVVGGQE